MRHLNLRQDLSAHRKGAKAFYRGEYTGSGESSGAAGLLSAQESEQRRIAREIHDGAGQKLALLEIKIERMKREAAAELATELESLRGAVAELAEELHRICHGLHPAVLDQLGLAAGIEALTDQCTRMSGVAVSFSHNGVLSAPTSVSLCIYRVVQEALHNVTEHSLAKRAAVILRGSEIGIQVVIRDAGCGFDVPRARRNRTRANRGLGLDSVCERIRLLGGHCEIRSKPGRGTRITAFIPFPPPVEGDGRQTN